MSNNKIHNIYMQHDDLIHMLNIVRNRIHSNKEAIALFLSFEANDSGSIEMYKNRLVTLERIQFNLMESLN
ncbi:hypothetical protein VN23_06200 [Janthinobacterium sp. B9-8]|nr:hypothetical protein VN23_06200 [Janthinobacterium sp. B9-8]